jgi:hypothetical protein
MVVAPRHAHCARPLPPTKDLLMLVNPESELGVDVGRLPVFALVSG